ncbi:DUF5655 domain-containing protein [Marinactinospora rubrisoli]|uniref:DUF5655 domain-containing protein n=1 Tax=Marinactinospora rubrisoli TaxID=2715399 RepID=A0ABW2KJL4_9ACTN
MRARSVRLLEERTGKSLEWWNRRVAEQGRTDEARLREWLTGQGVTGYPQALLVMERFGYPDFFSVSGAELIDAQYRDRPHLRPILDALLDLLPSVGDAAVQARKTLVALMTPRRKFAVVKPTTRSRVDLGLRLARPVLGGRLLDPKVLRDDALTARVALTSAAEVDHEVAESLRRAFADNL